MFNLLAFSLLSFLMVNTSDSTVTNDIKVEPMLDQTHPILVTRAHSCVQQCEMTDYQKDLILEHTHRVRAH